MRVKVISWDEEAFANFVVSAVAVLGGAVAVVMAGYLFARLLSDGHPFRALGLLALMVLGLVLFVLTAPRKTPSLREGEPSIPGLADLRKDVE